MNALNTSKAHCAFWVSPEKPDLYDQYSNGSIDTWMKTRNSEYNFINGEKGDFYDGSKEKFERQREICLWNRGSGKGYGLHAFRQLHFHLFSGCYGNQRSSDRSSFDGSPRV